MNTKQSEKDFSESIYLEKVRSGDNQAFEQLIEPYRHELLVHSYRFLGSFEDAEDVMQETLLRAWQRLATFEGRASFRAWLYKIATNASLDALDRRKRRAMSSELYPRGDPQAALPQPLTTANWVEAFPDAMIDREPAIYPEARYEIHESITLAFVAALQHLPGRQRAALLLRDVLGWDTNEVAEILNMTTVAVNSALQRARQTMQQHWTLHEQQKSTLNDELRSSLLRRYVAAWETSDSQALVAILRDDVALTMPPFPVWFGGRTDIQTFLDRFVFSNSQGLPLRLVPTRANSSPAFAVYQKDNAGIYKPAALHVLSFENGQISEINDFLTFDDRLFSRFGLPVLG